MKIYYTCIDYFTDYNHFQEGLQYLSQDRKEKIDKYKFEKDKIRSLVSGLLLTYSLKQEGVEQISIQYGERGKPFLSDYNNIFFNLSHSGNIVLCCVSHHNIGCDVEQHNIKHMRSAKRIMSEQEFQIFQSIQDAQEKCKFFFTLWTLKESYMKYNGMGLSLDPRKIAFDFEKRYFLKNINLLFYTMPLFREYEASFCYEQQDEINSIEYIEPSSLLYK